MDSHAHTPAAAAPGVPAATAHGHDAHDVRKDVKKYLTVFMYYIHIPSVPTTIAIALFIATVKAALVAGFFMHLISERKAVYAVLLATVFFFAAMMYLIAWHRAEVPTNSTWWEGNITKKEGSRHAIR